jgi:hypothetical protein
VLTSERLEHELGSLVTERDLEVGRDELGHATDRRASAQVQLGKRTSVWANVRNCHWSAARSKIGSVKFAQTLRRWLGRGEVDTETRGRAEAEGKRIAYDRDSIRVSQMLPGRGAAAS